MTAAVDDQTGKPAPSRSRLPRPVYDAALGALIMLALVVDAVITLILEVLYLPLYLGSVAFPIAAPLAGVINVALVLGARTVSPRPIVMLIPIVAWTLSLLAAPSTRHSAACASVVTARSSLTSATEPSAPCR